MNLMDHLAGAKKSLFRFEFLQEYDAGEKENLTEWQKTGQLNEELFKEWWSFLEKKHGEGVITQRVRRVVYPLNEYTQWELEVHGLSMQHGDDIREISDDHFKSLNIPVKDFWLIDDSIVLKMNYSNDGKYLGITEESDAAPYIKYKESLMASSEALSIEGESVIGKSDI